MTWLRKRALITFQYVLWRRWGADGPPPGKSPVLGRIIQRLQR